MKTVFSRFVLFALLGLIPTAAYYVFAISLVETGALNPALALPTGFVAAVIISYQLNKKFTWKPDIPHNRHFQFYLLISLFGALTNYLVYAFIVQFMGNNYIYAVLAVTIIIPVQNFFLNERYNFK